MGYFIGALVLAWLFFVVYQGYVEQPKPPLTLKDAGGGIMEPVCAHCQTRLVSVSRKTQSGFVAAFAMLLGLVGAAVFLLFHWIAGSITIILAVIIHQAGKGTRSVLTCPACGRDAKTLS